MIHASATTPGRSRWIPAAIAVLATVVLECGSASAPAALPAFFVSGQALAATAAQAPAALPPVVSTEWLAGRLGDPGLVILDARPSLRDYLAGHIPGAQPLGVENVRSVAGGVPGQIFPSEMIGVIAGRLGIGGESQVVVYGAENDPDATFVASVLRISGAGVVSVLDGGLKRWQAENRPTSTDRKSVPGSRPKLTAEANALASLEEVLKAIGPGGAVIVDARPQDQFEAGRIPGAVGRFWKNDLVPEGQDRAGLMKPAPDLEKEYAALGVTKDRPVIVYCNTGHMASEVFYALRYRLGHPDARLYDGSWTEWTMRPDLPKETGPAAPKAEAARP